MPRPGEFGEREAKFATMDLRRNIRIRIGARASPRFTPLFRVQVGLKNPLRDAEEQNKHGSDEWSDGFDIFPKPFTSTDLIEKVRQVLQE